MITVIVMHRPPARAGNQPVQEMITDAAPRYARIPGLLRKTFIGPLPAAPEGAEAGFAGGVYEFTDQASAEAWFNEDWQTRMLAMTGEVPQLIWFSQLAHIDGRAAQLVWSDKAKAPIDLG